MTIDDVLPTFGNRVSALADALNISVQAVYKWPDGKIPKKQELRLKYEILPKLKTK